PAVQHAPRGADRRDREAAPPAQARRHETVRAGGRPRCARRGGRRTGRHRDGHVEGIIPAVERYEDASVAPDQGLRRLAYRLVSDGDTEPLAVPRQLPPPPPYFIGRDGLLAEVR